MGWFGGLIVGLLMPRPGSLDVWLGVLAFGLIFGLIFGLVGGLAPCQIVTRTIPNEGIRRSLRNALISFLASGLAFGLIFRLVLASSTDGHLTVALVGGLTIGLVGGLVNGGSAYLKHYVLRLLLWRNDYEPWNYVRFLDYAAERVLLRKVGGGYIFTHRLLMEYFATTLQLPDQAR